MSAITSTSDSAHSGGRHGSETGRARRCEAGRATRSGAGSGAWNGAGSGAGGEDVPPGDAPRADRTGHPGRPDTHPHTGQPHPTAPTTAPPTVTSPSTPRSADAATASATAATAEPRSPQNRRPAPGRASTGHGGAAPRAPARPPHGRRPRPGPTGAAQPTPRAATRTTPKPAPRPLPKVAPKPPAQPAARPAPKPRPAQRPAAARAGTQRPDARQPDAGQAEARQSDARQYPAGQPGTRLPVRSSASRAAAPAGGPRRVVPAEAARAGRPDAPVRPDAQPPAPRERRGAVGDTRYGAASVTPAGADWLASASVFPRSVHALWAARPSAPSVLPCGIALDVVSAPALFGRRMVDRLWCEGSGPVAVQRGRVLLFTRPGVAQRLPSLLSWEEWGTGVVPPLLCHGAGDAVTIPPLRAPEPAGFEDPAEAADPFAGPFLAHRPEVGEPRGRGPGPLGGPAGAAHPDAPRPHPAHTAPPCPGAEAGPYREGAYEETPYAAGAYGARMGSSAGAPDPVAGALASVASAAAGGADTGSRWLVAPDVRHPWLPGPDVLLWACVRAARGRARGVTADTPVTRASPSGRG